MSDQTPSTPARVRRRATRSAGATSPAEPLDQTTAPDVEDAVASPDATVLPTTSEPVAAEPVAESEAPELSTDPAASDVAASDAAASDAAEQPRRRWFSPLTSRPLLVVALVLLIAAAPAATLGVLLYRHHDQESLRGRYVQFASAMVLDLTAYKPDGAAENMKLVASGSSGDFRDEVDKAATDFPKILQMAGVSSDGQIASAGVENADGHGATVLVAENLSVKDIGNDAPTARIFQFRVTIQNNDGNLTVTQMEMVS